MDDQKPGDGAGSPAGGAKDEDEWRAVEASEDGGTRAEGEDGQHPAWRGDSPADLLSREFLRAPEGEVQEGSLVVRPSMRAALDRVLKAFLVITPFFLPLALDAALGLDDDGGASSGGVFVLVTEVAGNLIIPFVVSLVPAVQLAFTRYILDDEGVRERVQLLSRSDKRVRWDKVTALRHRRTLFDRILGVERIDIVAYGKRGTTIHLVGLRRAPYIRDMVARQMRAQATVAGMLRND